VNLFAINAAALNDSNEVWSWYGASELVASSDAEPALWLRPDLDEAAVAVATEGEGLYGRAGEGDAFIVLSADGEGTRWVIGASDAGILLEAIGEGVAVGTSNAYFPIAFTSTLIPYVAGTVQLEGAGAIRLDTSARYRIPGTVYLSAKSSIHVGAAGAGFLILDAPGMDVELLTRADGAARLGGKLQGEGRSTIQVYSRGALDSRHYVYAEGSAAILLQAIDAKAGIPPIPDHYIAAPAIRSLRINNEPRLFTVPAERRL